MTPGGPSPERRVPGVPSFQWRQKYFAAKGEIKLRKPHRPPIYLCHGRSPDARFVDVVSDWTLDGLCRPGTVLC